MAKSTAATLTPNMAGQALNTLPLAPALPVLPSLPELGQLNSVKLSQASQKQLAEAEELFEDLLVLEEAPLVAETDTLGDVLMAQASVPAAAATTGAPTTAAAATAAAPVAAATGFAGMSGLGLLGAAAGVLSVAAVANSGGGGSPAVVPVPLFSVTDIADVVRFSGAATGDITVSIVEGVATFSRGANQASNTVTSLNGKTIDLAADQVLNMTLAEFQALEGLKITGAGDVYVDGTALSGTLAVTELVLINVVLDGGDLTFDLPADDNAILELKAGSVIDLTGGDLIVDDGTVNFTDAVLSNINDLTVNSKAVLTYTQLSDFDGQVFTAADGTPGALEVVLSSADQATALKALLDDKLAGIAASGEGSSPTLAFSIKADGEDAFNAIFAVLAPAMIEIGEATGTAVAAVLTAAQVIAVNESPVVGGAYALTITEAISVANLNKIGAATTGLVTASISGSADELAGLAPDGGTNAITVTVTAGEASALDLLKIGEATSLIVDATRVTQITGNLADVAAAKSAEVLNVTGVSVSVTDAGAALMGATFNATGDADVLTLDGSVGTTDLSNLTGFETFNLVGSTGAITIADGAGTSVFNTDADVTVILGDGGQSFISTGAFDANVTSGNGNDTITGGAGTNTVTYTNSTLNASMLTAIVDADPLPDGVQSGWQVAAGADGTDILTNIKIVDGAGGGQVPSCREWWLRDHPRGD